jgi:hypothetical protein
MSLLTVSKIQKESGSTNIDVPSTGQFIDLASAAQGDVLYYNGTSYVRLAPGTSGQHLQTAGAAANPIWGDAGGGKVLQVVQPAAITSFATSTTSATFVDITGMTLSITPTLSTSKILVSFVLQIGVNTGWHANLRLMRDSTAIAIGDSSGSRKQATADVGYNVSMLNVGVAQFLDAPATTSATTYKAQWATESGGTIYLNRSHGNTDNANFAIGVSTITAMEIGV